MFRIDRPEPDEYFEYYGRYIALAGEDAMATLRASAAATPRLLSGVTEPQATFSACFGAVFLVWHPTKYANMLGELLDTYPETKVWLVNTGWSGGAYGTGSRMKLSLTRAMVRAALAGPPALITRYSAPARASARSAPSCRRQRAWFPGPAPSTTACSPRG